MFQKFSKVDCKDSHSDMLLTHGCQDVRKINVGDCALFEPQQDSPPFIGIIRSLGSDKENLLLGVNWLYRPADLKLVKGVAVEAAPNEVFYSFHSDEISAASLLHPCKVAFLPKGVELPSGVSSFVCRRVYDTKNKCLWWLTDREFINDQQEEVDKLLRKTQSEMHATVQQQQGGRSPKPGSSPMSASQLKQSPDSVQNSVTTFPAHQKAKKRERNDQVSESSKRERSLRVDDGDFGLLSMLKSEIAKITDKGGLVDSEGVERLVQLMHPDISESRIDVACRSLIVGVIAATDKVDFLNRFVQLRGLLVLDEWLQDVHKGKIGDFSSHRDNDRSVEDFLLVLLRALDRLPVNLNALQMCNIGKSVNLLRSHRNAEIQKKSRTLVDTWKKRVELEMNMKDSKSASTQAVTWTARTRQEVSHGGNRHAGGSSDTSTKNSVSQLSSKPASVKLVAGEAVGKTATGSASPGNVKLSSSPASTGTNTRDGHLRTSVISSSSELPQSATRDDKSSSSSQSHTNSQCSSDHAKNPGFCGKEDTRSSNSGSTSLTKSSGSVSRQRKSANGLQGLAASAIQRDGGSSRNNSLARVSTAEKLSQSPSNCEKTVDVPISDSNNHKLIVKISNRGRSPAQSVNGGSIEDPSLTNSRASSPVHSEKHVHSDRSSKARNDGCQNSTMPDTNNESWQSNDLKDGAPGCDEGSGSPAAAQDFGRFQSGEETGKLAEVKVVASSKSEMKPRNSLDSSLSSINALIESCVKYSEGNASLSIGDDGGMNLLASVAAGEISKSDGASPAHSPQGSASVADETIRLKSNGDGDVSGESCLDQNQSNDAVELEAQKQKIGGGALQANEGRGDHFMPRKDVLHGVDMPLKSDGKINESGGAASVSPSPTCATGVEAGQVHESKAAVKDNSHVCIPDRGHDATEDKGTDVKEQSPLKATETASLPAVHEKNYVKVEPNSNTSIERPQSVIISSLSAVRNKKSTVSYSIVSDLLPRQLNDLKVDDVDMRCDALVKLEANKNLEAEKNSHPAPSKQEESELKTGLADQKTKDHEKDMGNKQLTAGSANKTSSTTPADNGKELCSHAKSSKLAVGEVIEECADTSLSAAGCSGTDGRPKFDLNEGFNVDDSKDEDQSGEEAPGCPSSFHSSTPLIGLSVASASASINVPTLVTVAAAAKGPFVPPEDLLRNKGELGWKGSAATSAFRPAEPRKVPELPPSNNNSTLIDVSTGKQGRALWEIDLNIADESILEDVGLNLDTKQEIGIHCGATQGAASLRSAGGLDLDLNRVEEAPESAQPPSISYRSEARFRPAKMSSSSGLSNSEGGRRDFDLNNGPAADEATVDSSSYHLHGRPHFPLQPSIGFRINSSEVGNLNSWYPTGSPFSAIPIPPSLADREQHFPIVGTSGGPPRILGAPMGTMSFNPELYRGSVLSSSPAVPFPAAPFQYPVFPFGTSFPLPSSSLPGGSTAFVDLSSGGRLCIPAVPSQLVGSAPAVSSQYPRPYVVSLSDVSHSVAVENHRKWGRQGLDLNAGPGGPEIEGRDETLPIPPRPVSTIGSLALADDQSRIYPMAGGILKRKEPEGGWDTDRLSGYRQPSWQ